MTSQWEHLGGIFVVRHILSSLRNQQIRVALEIAGGDHCMLSLVLIVRREVVSPVIKRVTELSAHSQRL